MPLVRLEYTQECAWSKSELKQRLCDINRLIVDTIDAQLASCKASAQSLPVTVIGDQVDHAGFVVLKVSILSGRSKADKQRLMCVLKEYLVSCFDATAGQHPAVRVWVTEIDRDFYAMNNSVIREEVAHNS